MKKIVPTFEDFLNESKKVDVTSFPDNKMSAKKLMSFKPKIVDEADWNDAIQYVTNNFSKTASPIEVAEKYNDGV